MNWIETTWDTKREEKSAVVDEAWTLETDSLRIVVQCRKHKKHRDLAQLDAMDWQPNWILKCFGSVIVNYHDLDTPSLEEAKIKAIQHLKKKIKYIALELTEPIGKRIV